MNKIIGTELPDILSGTDQDDLILGLAGDDTLIASQGDDTLNGGNSQFQTVSDNDTADYSSLGGPITLRPQGELDKGVLGKDLLVNINTIIAPQLSSTFDGARNTIDASTASGKASIVINLNQNQLKVRNAFSNTSRVLTFNVQNFQDVIGTNRRDLITGDDQDNTFQGLGGNDQIWGGAGFDTADYRGETAPITLLPTGVVTGDSTGTDQLFKVERIIAPLVNGSLIDASSAGKPTSIDVNLQASTLSVENIPVLGSLELTVENFVNVNGTDQNDTIVGDANNNVLTGLHGNDILSGGAGNDRLIGGNNRDVLAGTDSVARGQFEFDVLRGGRGRDRFILGDASGAYYKDEIILNDDFSSRPSGSLARIDSFCRDDRIILGTGETYRIKADAQGFDIFTVTAGVSDLIADVRSRANFNLPKKDFMLQSGKSMGCFLSA